MNEENNVIPMKSETETEPKTEKAAAPKKPSPFSAEGMLENLSKGKLTLQQPFMYGKTEVKELLFDFDSLSGFEVVDALEKGARMDKMNNFRISVTQALYLFSAAAAKVTPGGMDMQDIRTNLGSVDCVRAIHLGTIFFNASGQVGEKHTSKE